MKGHGDTEPFNTCALSDLPMIYASARYARKYCVVSRTGSAPTCHCHADRDKDAGKVA